MLTLFIHFMCTDYVPNADHMYNFDSGIGSLPIATVLLTDRIGEGIESFVISLLPPEATSGQMMGTAPEIVYPSNVTVIIIDDDCKDIHNVHIWILCMVEWIPTISYSLVPSNCIAIQNNT